MVAISKGKKGCPYFPGSIVVSYAAWFVLLLAAAWLYWGTRVALKPSGVESTSGHGICPVTSLSQLSYEELHPKEGDRHMVTPPDGGRLTLVCCDTTKGRFSALLHHQWAPLGVDHLVTMIKRGYFDKGVPLFRCTDACQFGLSRDPNITKTFQSRIQDDPMWLPPGKDHREKNGVRRYPAGMWTYAGSGNNSRSNQFVITLKPNKFMGGGSPWEVPLGELVGADSFKTIGRWYTGYGEKGPSQAILHNRGHDGFVQKNWPRMDTIWGCRVMDEARES